ncbi:methyltransferase, FxLD system [Halostreptopolyspora alba]|uniref:Protein-L-isoaspartate O-methyltransferase n=1 Tax=Halostreptopolyspora alba TaxID=2487137 RepID=A0A3N0ECJ0_9ACTN|nr:methyltransferase, FxLD system [Nocardiopsaceae bacterium YIM 96095]
MTSETTTTSPEALRSAMVARIRTIGHAYRHEVEQVLLTTERQAFLPHAELDEAHDPHQAVVTHRFDDGRPRALASAPWLVAAMLDQLDVHPGMRVLEIGAGTGYNACLLAQLTGSPDLVTTIDIDADVTAQASRALEATGYGGVHVITGDGALGYSDHAPYDRIIVTVSPWDIPTAWRTQLAPGGRLVAPVRWRGQSRSAALTNRGDRLVSDSLYLCGFVYLVGEDEGELAAPITEDERVTLHWDRDQPVEPAALRGGLDQPRLTTWSGTTLAANESHDGLWLRLTTTDARVCRLKVQPEVPREVCDPVPGWWRMALAEGNTLVYLTVRRVQDGDEVRGELGAIGHGPAAAELTEYLCQQIRDWAPSRAQDTPTLTIYPADTPDCALAGPAIDKPHSRFVLTYDDPSTTPAQS